MKNKIPIFSLLFFFTYAIRTEWTPAARILVILNSFLVLLQSILQLQEVMHHVRK